ncbi:hypothetical protein P43SY_006171 [Pythium insidiosum]|uniref:Transmembrane protein n=1 Tax=Pythium insidiosum TaxID=114742 RepID=A0AAD5LZ51_PYTIN|nr:hypothetical protein P43SY_006171 [Pythium insidiosum]
MKPHPTGRIVPLDGRAEAFTAADTLPSRTEPPVSSLASRARLYALQSSTEDDELFGVAFGRTGYILAWLGVYALHAVCGAYYIIGGLLYWYLPKISLSGYLELYSLTVNRVHFRKIAVVHYLVAVAHLRFLVTTVVYRVYRRAASRRLRHRIRRLQRNLSSGVLKRFSTRRLRLLQAQGTGLHGTERLNRGLVAMFKYIYLLLFARSGFFGVKSNYFEFLFLGRELVETTLQSYQAFEMNRLLPRLALTRFYVAVLVLNCWLAPLLHRVVKHKPLQRMLCMLADIVLDFVSAIAVPVLLALSYVRDYDPELGNFPNDLWYDDKWLVNFMNESPVILFGSWVDALSRLLFSTSLLLSMEDVKDLIQKRRHPHPRATQSDQPPTARADGEQQHVTKSSELPGNEASNLLSDTSAGAAKRATLIRLAHRLIVTYGFAVLSVQLHAELKARPLACVLEVHPWLVRRPACALVEINCNPRVHRGVSFSTANASEVSGVLRNLDSASLAHLVVRHCQQVMFTSDFQHFPNLVGLKLYNSSVDSWPEEAALYAKFQPKLRFAFFARTNFAEKKLPVGLLSSSFPPTLHDVEFTVTNLRTLPSDLHTLWPTDLTLFLEFGEFEEFPMTLTKMQLHMLTFAGNPVRRIDAAALMMQGTTKLSLSGVPIDHLPDEGVDVSTMTIRTLFLDYTNLSSLPAWMDAAFLQERYVCAGRTPLCDEVLAAMNATDSDGSAAPNASSLLANDPRLELIDCMDYGVESLAFYPLGLESRDDETWPSELE